MRASSWLYQYSSQTKFTYGVCATLPNNSGQPPQPPPTPQQQHHQHTPPLVYNDVADYNNGRSSLTPYALQQPTSAPHDMELGVAAYHQMQDEGQIAVPWSKERTLVKQEPGEVRDNEFFFNCSSFKGFDRELF